MWGFTPPSGTITPFVSSPSSESWRNVIWRPCIVNLKFRAVWREWGPCRLQYGVKTLAFIWAVKIPWALEYCSKRPASRVLAGEVFTMDSCVEGLLQKAMYQAVHYLNVVRNDTSLLHVPGQTHHWGQKNRLQGLINHTWSSSQPAPRPRRQDTPRWRTWPPPPQP